jgi:hypothetical protein
MRTIQEVIDSLNALNADGIHDLLAKKGIRGRRHITTDCPIANYVRIETDIFVQVGAFTLIDRTSTSTSSHVYRLGDSIADFIMTFDEEQYPDLIRS